MNETTETLKKFLENLKWNATCRIGDVCSIDTHFYKGEITAYNHALNKIDQINKLCDKTEHQNETIEIIKKGFEFLKEDCRSALLSGFVYKKDIPQNATKEIYDLNEHFSHEYSDLKTDGWDDADFWGKIYLPLKDGIYMEFEVYA